MTRSTRNTRRSPAQNENSNAKNGEKENSDAEDSETENGEIENGKTENGGTENGETKNGLIENGDAENETGFQWIGDSLKVNRRMFFERCKVNGTEVSVANNVEIKLGEESCAVALLLELYESAGADPHRAKVRWYYPYKDLPRRCQTHASSDDVNEKELYRPGDDLFLGSVEEIDAETIFNVVTVRDIGPNDVIPSDVYFSRYYFTNTDKQNPLTPIFDEHELQNVSEEEVEVDEEDEVEDGETDEEVQINYTKLVSAKKGSPSKRKRNGAEVVSKSPSKGKTNGAEIVSKSPSKGKRNGAGVVSKSPSKGKRNGTEVVSASPLKCSENDSSTKEEQFVMSGKMKKNAERWKSYSADEVIAELWKTTEKDNKTRTPTKRKLNTTPNYKSIDPNNDTPQGTTDNSTNNERHCDVVISPLDSKIRRTSDGSDGGGGANSNVSKQIDFILPDDPASDACVDIKMECTYKVSPFKAALPKKEVNVLKVFEFDADTNDKGVSPGHINRSAKKIARKLIATSEDGEEYLTSDENVSPDDDFQTAKYSLKKRKKRTQIAMPKKKKNTRVATPVTNGKTKTSMTPKSVKQSEMTPSISARKTPRAEAKGMLELARKRLHVSAVPDTLPCRDLQFSQIFAFVQDRLKEGTGGCMYISGVPGTGKTATVHEVVRTLKENIEVGVIPDFKFVEVNGMKLTDPNQIYPHILKELEGKKATPDHAADLLTQRFKSRSPKKENVVLLVDELDLLCNRKQNVMYNIFDWPTHIKSQLVVLAIANTMDLPERVMMNRVSSRLGTNRMTFQPYTYKELQEIVLSRISKWIEAFEEDALQLVARKVAAVSGDARRCLDICRRAVEICENLNAASKKQTKDLVSMKHVELALKEMFSSPKIIALQALSDMETMFMKAVISEFRRTGLEEAIFMEVYDQFKSHCALEDGIEPPNMSEAFTVCNNLGSVRLLLVETGNKDIHQRVRLNVNMDDVMFAFKSKNP